MAFKKLDEVNAAIAEKRKGLREIFAEAGPEMDMDKVKALSGSSDDKVAEIQKRNAELDGLAAEQKKLNVLAKAAERSQEDDEVAERHERKDHGAKGERKSLGELFTESAEYKADRARATAANLKNVEVKTLFQTTAGWAPEVTRSGVLVPYVVTPIDVVAIFPVVNTSQSANKYMRELLPTNNAAEVAEAGVYAESAYATEEVTDPIRKIGHTLPVTDEQLDDVDQARSFLETRLIYGVRQRLNGQLVNGLGTGITLRGVLNVAGTNTQAIGSDDLTDAILKAATLAELNGQAAPNVVLLHPLHWQNIRLMRTTDGHYLWGHPSEVGPGSIFGLTVAKAQGLPTTAAAGKAVVGDFANFSELVARKGIEVQTTNSHASEFTAGTQRMRADIRVGVTFYRPSAFTVVTGI